MFHSIFGLSWVMPCHVVLKMHMKAGVHEVLVNPSGLSGEWYLPHFFGLFGQKGIIDALMVFQLH